MKTHVSEIIQRIDNGIAIICLSRPDRRNAFNQPLREKLAHCLEALGNDASVRGIVITGAGKHFSVGGDIDAFVDAPVSDLRTLLAAAHRSIVAIRNTAKPVVAAVEGYAVGGAAGLALACDAMIVAEGARIGFPFLKLGLAPDWGSLHLLREKIGESATRRLLLRPSLVNSSEAIRLGLADDKVNDREALQAAITLIDEFTRFSSTAWGHTKAMLNHKASSLEDALKDEVRRQEACFISEEFQTALKQFVQRNSGHN